MYDIAEAFERIENELISSMMRNISKHIADEQREGIQYSQWQAEQIKALARYRQHNAAKYGTQFSDINAGLDTVIRQIYASARMSEEVKILEAVKHGLISAPSDFFTTDNNKLDMLIESVTSDFQKAEYAVLRRADDMYRQIIFNSQVYLNSGAGTLRQAIDMASKDFISAGINCIQYKDGRLVNISSYAEMALRTANQRAKFAAEGNERAAYGIHTVLISSHNGACPFCQKWQGRVYIDDVYSGGKPDGKYPLLSSAIAGGMFHPNCQNGLSTFIEGISSEPQPPTAETMKQQTELYNLQQQQRYNERQIRKYKRLSEYSLDDENRQKYSAKLKEWQKRQRNLIADNPDVLRRQYDRERNDLQKNNYTNYRRGNPKGKDLFNIDINYSGDSVTHRRLFNELNKSSIGKSVIEYIREHNINIHISYDVIEDTGHMGHCLLDSVTIFAQNTKSVKNTAKTIIHECTHLKYNIGGCQWAEAVCFAQEVLHEKGVLTVADKRAIIKHIKQNYPDFKWRKGGANNG